MTTLSGKPLTRARLNSRKVIIAASVLAGAISSVHAETVTTTLDMDCSLPLLGTYRTQATVTTEQPPIPLTGEIWGLAPVETTINFSETPIQVFDLVGAEKVQGEITTVLQYETDSGLMAPIDLVGSFKPVDLACGDSVNGITATVNQPSIQADINFFTFKAMIDDIEIDFRTDGPDPYDEFTSECTIRAGQDRLLFSNDTIAIPSESDATTTDTLTVESESNTSGLEFPSTVYIGETASNIGISKEFTITNTGTEVVELADFAITLRQDEFAQYTECDQLAPGESCGVTVGYYPLGTSETVCTFPSRLEFTANSTLYAIDLEATYTGTQFIADPFIHEVSGSVNFAGGAITAPISGTFEMYLNLANNSVKGPIALNPVPFEFDLSFPGLFASARLEFDESIMANGQTSSDEIGVAASSYFTLPQVDVSIFGLITIPFTTGPECKTTAPVNFTWRTTAGSTYLLYGTTPVTGPFTIPPFENCGRMTSIINEQLNGEENWFELNLKSLARIF